MQIQKTTGITLSTKLIGDADCITKIFTKDFGKREFVFKGLKKTKKRQLTINEPGTVSELIYYYHENKNLFTVNEYQVLQYNKNINENLKNIFLLYFIVELVDKTCAFNDTNTDIYNLLSAATISLPQNIFIENFALFFTLHLIKHQGLYNDFSKCISCNNVIKDYLSIDFAELTTYCPACVSNQSNLKKYSLNILDFLIKTNNTKFSSIDHNQYSKENLISFLKEITCFIENYYHINISSKPLFFEELATLK